MNKHLLDILCCPVSKSPLRPLARDQLKHINTAVERGEVDTIDNERVTNKLEEGLITTDGKVIYRVVDDIPVLLPEEGIGITQFTDFPPG